MMRYFNRIIVATMLGSTGMGSFLLDAPSVHAVTLPVDQLYARNVTATQAELTALGCEQRSIAQPTVQAPDSKPYAVRSSDAREGDYHFCSSDVIQSLTSQGRVAGLQNDIGCIVNSALAPTNPGSGLRAIYDCLNSELAQEAVVEPVGGWFLGKVLEALSFILVMINALGMFILGSGVTLLSYTLSPTRFATHDLVTTGWPIVQGISNLGFIVALLAIAFGTVLQIEDFNVKRMLPRLLFAALLINFSLLIGTIIVDTSRLVMAVEVAAIGGVSDVQALPNQILLNSRLMDIVLHFGSNYSGVIDWITSDSKPISDGLTLLAKTLFATLLIWGAALAFIIIGIMFLIRYVAILFLLAISPIAYLALALPRAGNLASRWWTSFLKYVLYGPAALFMLLLLVEAVQTPLPNFGAQFFGRGLAGNASSVLDSVMVGIVTIILLYMAATVGRYMGLFGAAATVSFVTGKAKQIGRGAGLAAMYPARLAGRGVKRSAQDFTREATPAIREIAKRTPVVKYFVPPKRDKDGKLKPGQQSLGQKLGYKFLGQYNPKQRADINEVQNAWNTNLQAPYGAGDWDTFKTALQSDVKYSPSYLSKPHVLFSMRGDNTDGTMSATGKIAAIAQYATGGQIRGIVREKYFINSLKKGEIEILQQSIKDNENLSDREEATIIDQLLRTLEEG